MCYRVEENNPNLLKCIMVGMDRARYVDLLTNKEVNTLSIQVVANEAGKEDTIKLTGKEAEKVNTDEIVSLYNLDKEEEKAPEYRHKKTPLSAIKKTQKPKQAKKAK
jgi:hypothetical protein